MGVLLSDLCYDLPPERIAQIPLKERASARLLVTERSDAAVLHQRFSDLPNFLRGGDLLVLNNSRVIPARIFANRKSGGKVELFLLKETAPNEWTALVRPNRRVKKGEILSVGENGEKLDALIKSESVPASGERTILFSGEQVKERLYAAGHVPLPPYIPRPDNPEDREYYQTVYAKQDGSVAAPTAGLHFDEPLLTRIQAMGVEIAHVTLHVNYGTFKMIEEEDIRDHPMHDEEYEISERAASQINQALAENRRVIACGTTSVRVLESAVDKYGKISSGSGSTRLFIYSPYTFKVVQGLITNFHLPRSTLLCLVDAFLGEGRWRSLYEEAIREKYRFYSYGDAMLIL